MTGGEKRSFDQMEEGSSVDVDDAYVLSSDQVQILEQCTYKRPKFIHHRACNYNLDTDTKIAAFKVDQSIVSLVSFSGKAMLTQSCGTIIERVDDVNTVMSSLSLVREPMLNSLAKNLKVIVQCSDDKSYVGKIEGYDFHYNLVIIKFKSMTSFSTAKLKITEDVNQDRHFQLRPHSLESDPKDVGIVVGRYFYQYFHEYQSFDLMAAPGKLSKDREWLSEFSCYELLSYDCSITRCGDGSPLINLAGEVVGIAYYLSGPASAILPIDIAHRWWSHYKKFKESRHPSYGFITSNMYSASLPTLARVVKKFPSISNGLIVDKVQSGSYAEAAGLREDDVIIKCDGKSVKSPMEVWNMMWDKIGNVVELEVARVDICSILSISVVVGEATSKELNKWPRNDYR